MSSTEKNKRSSAESSPAEQIILGDGTLIVLNSQIQLTGDRTSDKRALAHFSNGILQAIQSNMNPLTKNTLLAIAVKLSDCAPEEQTKYNMPYFKLEKEITLASAYDHGTQLQTLVRVDEGFTLKIMMALLSEFCNSFNVGKNMTLSQIHNAALLLMEKYRYENVEDFIVCFKRAKLGNYGKIFDRIDIEVIAKFMDQYLEDKSIYAEQARQNRKREEDEEKKKTSMNLSTFLENNPEEKKKLAKLLGNTEKPKMNEDEYKKIKADFYKQRLKKNNE